MRRLRFIEIPLTNGLTREDLYDNQGCPCVSNYGKLVKLTAAELKYPCYWFEVKRGRDPLHYSESGMPAEGQMEIGEAKGE